MSVYTSTGGLQHVVGYGSNSVVIAHHNHSHPMECNHYYSSPSLLPPAPQPKRAVTTTTTTYCRLLPVTNAITSIIDVPVRQQSKQVRSEVFRDSFSFEQNRSIRGTSACIPLYNSLDDPHMQDYYSRRFGRRPKSTKRSNRPDALYRVTVKTADVKDAGTNAKIFISITGSKDKVCRKLLTRETMLRGQIHLSSSLNGLDKINDNDFRNIEYRRGSTEVVYIRCRDLGIIKSIVIENTGLLLEQGWLCEFILLTNVRTGRSYFFPCNKWLSLYPPGNGFLSLKIFPNDHDFQNSYKKKFAPESTDYKITVITGDVRGAGTDSQVYITLFSEDGRKTKKMHLQKSLNHDNPFERNQSDEFHIRGEYLGELAKLRIEHDNSGRLAGWYLSRIVVIDMLDSSTVYYAKCNAWLSKDEGDGQISRDLTLQKNIAGEGDDVKSYKVTVYTGNKMGAGTDADVFITLFGDQGKTDSIILHDKSKNIFEAGQVDTFTIECKNVGEIEKILIAHNNKGSAPGWFLDRILIEDLAEHRIYEFPCYKWLAKDEGDKQISRFLFPKKLGGPDKEPTAGIPYQLTIYTGDKSNAGTDARVYVNMHHKKQSSGKIFLTGGTFERKDIDIITIDGPDNLSPLTALDIGHDNTGVGPAWYLEKVVVLCPSTGIEQTFPCKAWLPEDSGAHLERRLMEDLSLRKQHEKTVPWYIWVYTSDVKGAGTDAEVTLVLYGHNGKSHDIKLQSESDTFEAGACDEFKRDIADVGQPYKLRVSHNNAKPFASWHLDRIEMENLTTRQRYLFRCGRWLSTSEDDRQLVRELPAEGPGISKPLPVVKYHVDVYTGDKMNAGTDANVFLNIFGDIGDTGERPLEYSNHKNKFERSQVDKFVIEAVSLKQIKKIRIGHDGSGPGAGWFLDKVVIRPEDTRYDTATFECNRWLAIDEDDRQIVRELTLKNAAQHLDKITYNVKIKTGDRLHAGTDADVHLKIFGKKGDTDKIELRASSNTSDKFERGRIDHFKFEFNDLGKITHILIGHNGKNPGAGWYLDWVEIDVPMRGEFYRFVCDRWLDSKEGDRKTEIEIMASEVIKKDRVIPYEVTVFTGDKSGAGTDAKVFIQMYGLNGKTEEIILQNESDTFERNAVDKFKIEAPDIGQIQKVRIGHNGEKMLSAWYLEKVLIQRNLSEDFRKQKRDFKSGRAQRLSQISATDANVEEYWFVCRQWFDKSKGDKATIRELLPTDAEGNPLSSRKEVTYSVHVFTGKKSGAGTDANVFLTIYGQHEDSGERELTHSKTNSNKFEENQEDIFDIKAIHLGKLRKIKIRHDNTGFGAAWYLDRVEIVDPETQERYRFICQNWLATNEGDGAICREIPAFGGKDFRLSSAREGSTGSANDFKLEMKEISTTYKIRVITSNDFGSGTDANVYIILFGENNDTGKVPLAKSKTHEDPFERGHTDEFEFEAMDVGEPKKIKIGHDNANTRPDWLLERVEIDVPKMGRTWIFPCGKWLSKKKGDCKLELELYPKAESTIIYNQQVPYEIKVFTSDLSGAGTDANIFIEIYGHEKSTGQVTLFSKTERKGKFQTGSVETCVLELEDVGKEITKIRIGHDDSGWGAAWHLDRVEIRRIEKNKKTRTFTFPCNRWLAKNEDDGSIVRELVPQKVIEEGINKSGQLKVREHEVEDQLEMKKYVVEVYTGNKFGCGTNANVYCTIFGDKGDSGERELAKSETHFDKFERNQMDRFNIECADLGNIYKLKIRHDNSGFSPDWLLSKVEVKDGMKSYIFYCEQWLSAGKDSKLERTLYEKDYQGSMSSLGSIPRSVTGSKASMSSNDSDSKIERFHPAQRKNMMSSIAEESRDPTDEGIPYTVKVKTGEKSDAGTSANAYIRLIGHRGRQTRLIPLELMQRKRFEPGKVETFSLQEPDIGDLEMVEIEHDGDTETDSWYLESINVEMPTKGRVFYFACNSWLSKHKGDGKTKRRLNVQDSNQGSFRPLIPYEISIYTGDVEDAGCDCDVSLKLFGESGSSSEHVFKKDEGFFERGAINRFKFELDDVGKLIKIRVTIIPKTSRGRNKWYLENIELVPQDDTRHKSYFFGLNDWISSETEFYRDISLSKGGRALLGTTTYRVTAKTSDIDGASSDSNISIVIFGHNGDSGELKLEESSTHMNKFERDHEDIFTFSNILSLGELTKVRVINDESSFFKPSWHLDHIKVEDVETKKTYTFPCQKWLSSKKDDKQAIRELVCENDSDPTDRRDSLKRDGKVLYEVQVTTSDKKNAGTTQNGWIVIQGSKKKSDKFYMKNTARKKILRSGQTDTFTFESRPLGELKAIILGHEERPDYPLNSRNGREAQWHVAHVTITDPTKNIKYEFPINQWIDIDDESDLFECSEKSEDAVTQQRQRQSVKYKIIVYTGDVSGAGTDANVSMILYGTLGDTGMRPLKKKGRNLFERNQVDDFIIECLDLGNLNKLHIEHDNALISPDWFLDKVEVVNMETDEKVEFPCRQWLGKKHDDGEIQRDLFPLSNK